MSGRHIATGGRHRRTGFSRLADRAVARLGAGATTLALCLTGLVAAAGTARATGPDTSAVLASLNASRAAAGLRPYVLRADLSAVAYRWAEHLAAAGRLSHNPQLTVQVADWEFVGENVGSGPSWSGIETAYMHSPEHRANILDHDFTEVGIGIVVSHGVTWVVQDFRRPFDAATAPVHAAAKPAKQAARVGAAAPAAVARPAAARHTVSSARLTAAGATGGTPEAGPAVIARVSALSGAAASAAATDPLAQALRFTLTMRRVAG